MFMNRYKNPAQTLGITPEYLYMILVGQRNPSKDLAPKVIDLLGGDLSVWRRPRTKTKRQQLWGAYRRELCNINSRDWTHPEA